MIPHHSNDPARMIGQPENAEADATRNENCDRQDKCDWYNSTKEIGEKEAPEYWEQHYAKLDDLQFDAALVAGAPLEFLINVIQHHVEDSNNEDSLPIEICISNSTCTSNVQHDLITQRIRSQLGTSTEEANSGSEAAFQQYIFNAGPSSIIRLTRSFHGLPVLEQNQEMVWEMIESGMHGMHGSVLKLDSNAFALKYTTKHGIERGIDFAHISDIVYGCDYRTVSDQKETSTQRPQRKNEIVPKTTIQRTRSALSVLAGVPHRLYSLTSKLSTASSHRVKQQSNNCEGTEQQRQRRYSSDPSPSSGESSWACVQSEFFAGLDDGRSFTLICSGKSNRVFQAADKKTRAHCVSQLMIWLQNCRRKSCCEQTF